MWSHLPLHQPGWLHLILHYLGRLRLPVQKKAIQPARPACLTRLPLPACRIGLRHNRPLSQHMAFSRLHGRVRGQVCQ